MIVILYGILAVWLIFGLYVGYQMFSLRREVDQLLIRGDSRFRLEWEDQFIEARFEAAVLINMVITIIMLNYSVLLGAGITADSRWWEIMVGLLFSSFVPLLVIFIGAHVADSRRFKKFIKKSTDKLTEITIKQVVKRNLTLGLTSENRQLRQVATKIAHELQNRE